MLIVMRSCAKKGRSHTNDASRGRTTSWRGEAIGHMGAKRGGCGDDGLEDDRGKVAEIPPDLLPLSRMRQYAGVRGAPWGNGKGTFYPPQDATERTRPRRVRPNKSDCRSERVDSCFSRRATRKQRSCIV
jgi:hypothetical protein